ncbi:AraC family transcriptional regulator [Acinetobacter seifertii]|uniref:AraC family transcriptional regulator n=1 Tax=Acinetobacter seifertii TaxID=1530123 RepID=UPI00083B8971|nr:AraC family transcriptional regulator [Acinetobacter seifertii]MBJ9425932.1 AraC family transcriptional regulator [Acinetobacter seifertii]OCZ55410.1 AraC family transcriptional regulator [Acinetobacter seifertii]
MAVINDLNPVIEKTKSLARKVDGLVQDEDFQTEISGFSLHRRTNKQSIHCIYDLGLGVILQGEKQVLIGNEIFTYSRGQTMLTTIDLPAVSRVTQASYSEPFLGMMLKLDIGMITEIAGSMENIHVTENIPSFSIEEMDIGLIEALDRLVDLVEDPSMIPQIAPLIKHEIIVRLLLGKHGDYLRNLIKVSGNEKNIFKVISWLRNNFLNDVRVDEIAEQANMTSATFRNHFREITRMTPLQYQKQLRLQEARKLMLMQSIEIRRVAESVGYESQSQFTREYVRLFGITPQKDLKENTISK